MRFFRQAESRLREITRHLGPLLYAGSNVFCPICNRGYRKFRAAGKAGNSRPNAVCYTCKGRERDRYMYQYLSTATQLSLVQDQVLLHVAPDPSLIPLLRNLASGGYTSIDLVRSNVNLRGDITELPFGDGAIEAIYCSHVLQDVPDDEAALREFWRVLSPTGWIALVVPFNSLETVPAPEDRRRRNAEDAPPMIRVYGPEVEDTLSEVGFKVQSLSVNQNLTEEQKYWMVVDQARVGAAYLLRK